MRTRIAMLSCYGPHTTPWMHPQGGESHVRIAHLMEGEHIVVEEDGVPETQYSSPGMFPFRPVEKFRFRKERTAPEGSPTMVEVMYE